jgi:uncharacterized protein
MAALCDTNVWLALALSGHRHHDAARGWLDSVDERSDVYFCRATQQSLVRLLTTRAVLGAYGNPPLSNAAAWEAYSEFLADDRIAMASNEPSRLEEVWKQYALRDAASPKLWMDSYLAAFAVAAGLALVTIDSDFLQFADLDVRLVA